MVQFKLPVGHNRAWPAMFFGASLAAIAAVLPAQDAVAFGLGSLSDVAKATSGTPAASLPAENPAGEGGAGNAP